MMETMGNDVVLPCVNTGTPRPQVYWIDGQNNLITSGPDMQGDDRYKVSDSGISKTSLHLAVLFMSTYTAQYYYKMENIFE